MRDGTGKAGTLWLKSMLRPEVPALILAPMEGITDAPMRDFMGSLGAFSFAVSEFQRVSVEPLPARVFRREAPEVANGGATASGLPVQVQILGGDPGRMAQSAAAAVEAGAIGIDLNFGCPAPTVNRHDGGASLLRHPLRIREIVRAVRDAVAPRIPVSAKLRLGWDDIEAIDENAAMAAEGGAAWITIHARTRTQGYQPPVYWRPIGRVQKALPLPIVANGDIWTLDAFRQCQEESGCRHFMLGRSALANPSLPGLVARELGLPARVITTEWLPLLRDFVARCGGKDARTLARLKQWLCLAHRHGDFAHFDRLKRSASVTELFDILETATSVGGAGPAASLASAR